MLEKPAKYYIALALLISFLQLSATQQTTHKDLVSELLIETDYVTVSDSHPLKQNKGAVRDQDPNIGLNEMMICDSPLFKTDGRGCFTQSITEDQQDWLEWNIEDDLPCSMSIGTNVHAKLCSDPDCANIIEIIGPMIYIDMNEWCSAVDLIYLKWYDEEADPLVMAGTHQEMELGYVSVFELGRYFYYDLTEKHMTDDMDSLYVPSGRKVTLYDGGDCTGDSEEYVGSHYQGTISLQNRDGCMTVEDMKISELSGQWVLIASSLSGEAIDFGYDIQMTYSQDASHTLSDELMYSKEIRAIFREVSISNTLEFEATFSTIMSLDFSYHYNMGCPESEEVYSQSLYAWKMTGYRPQLETSTIVLANSGLSSYYICRKNEFAHSPPDCPAEFCGYDGQCDTCLI